MKKLANYKAVADGIAMLYFPHAEVIIHDINTHTVVHIANNISKRQLGDDSALHELPGDFERVDNLGPYEKLNWNGQRIRSVTSVMRDDAGKPEALLCINMNFSVLEMARDALNNFFEPGRLLAQPEALFRDDWQEQINTFLHAWLQDHNLSLQGLTRNDKRLLVEALFAEGAFEGRSASDYIANVLSMGRATVYKYLKRLRDAP